MATIQSLGLHEPTALQYLIAESILPPEPSRSLYRWKTYQTPSDDGSCLVEEEILISGSCVAWSKGGVLKRLLNLHVEEEPILQAFTTSFSRQDEAIAGKEGIRRTSATEERGLVVILRSQAYIYFHSGGSHVFPLSFEVDSAFPCPYGFILQRKLGASEFIGDGVSPSFTHDLSTINESLGTIKGSSARQSLIPPNIPTLSRSSNFSVRGMPRTFSFTETMSEVGIVVSNTSSKSQPLGECKALPIGERMLYISKNDELHSIPTKHDPLCLAVTTDRSASTFTVWHVAREPLLNAEAGFRLPKDGKKGRPAQRKSSNIYGRSNGTATPALRGPSAFRESFGPLAQSHSDVLPHSSTIEQKSFGTEDLASQLGPEFGDLGVQTRSARRVSSMLARTDLGTANDRHAFNELAMGHGSRKSLNRPAHRGESIGSFSDRQSFGFPRRSSFPATTSILSNSASFLGVAAHGTLEDTGSLHTNRFGSDELFETESDLPREVGFFKIKSFPRSELPVKEGLDCNFKILTLLSPVSGTDTTGLRRDVSVCIMDTDAHQMTIVNVMVKFKSRAGTSAAMDTPVFQIKATNIRRGSGISDVTTVLDGSIQRLLLLSKSRTGHFSLHLEAAWSSTFRVSLPTSYLLYNPFNVTCPNTPNRRRDAGSNRVLNASLAGVSGVQGIGAVGQLMVTDSSDRVHLLALRLAPRDRQVAQILSMSNVVLGVEYHESLLLALWEVSRWLKEKEGSPSSEWTTLVVVLFTLAVPFIDDPRTKSPSQQRRKKTALLRSSSISAVDLTSWDDMKLKHDGCIDIALQSPPWAWLTVPQSQLSSASQLPTHCRSHSSQQSSWSPLETRNVFIAQCIAWARDFTQSPIGESAIGPEGYLAISVGKDRGTRQTALAKILVGMHLLYEERKLDTISHSKSDASATQMVAVMAQLGQWLDWGDWKMKEGGYYFVEGTDSDSWNIEKTTIVGFETPSQPFAPPSIFEHVDQCLVGDVAEPFPTMDVVADQSIRIALDHGNGAEVMCLTPRTYSLMSFFGGSSLKSSSHAMRSMTAAGVDKSIVSTFPDGLAAIFHQAVAPQQIHRSLLRKHQSAGLENSRQSSAVRWTHHASHDASKDYHTIGVAALETDGLQRWDASSEADRHTITRQVFHEDRRFQEASKLVNQTRPPVVECTPEPEWSEGDLLEAQKELAQFVTRRTLSVAAGRGMIHFNARVPLLTERVPIPAFSLQCVMKPRHVNESTQAMTFSADKAAFTEDKVCWAFFHNGASAGLMISKDAKGIDTSWILYNKPPELTNRHAGFLLALGLNGHLKTLAKWVAFKYLTPKHTMTSVGLLLGLSASYLGTMDTLITRLLSVHVTRLLPPGAAELNLSPLTQTTGIIGIGLLYHNSQHRRMSEIMLSEIENDDSEEGVAEDSVLRDEGYRLAAGFSLGLINLGHGRRLHGLHDMRVVERLLSIAIGTKNVNLVHVLDRATAGAVMAVAFIFLKSNDESVARKIDIPDTIHQFDYVRPDVFLLRTLARHLIMWDAISPTQAFVRSSLPHPYQRRASLRTTKHLSTEDMPFFNVVAGICFAVGLRFAGTLRHDVRDLLVTFLDQFLRISRLPSVNYDARVTLNSVRNCLDVVALATATVMAGSGDLIVMRRLRALHGRTDRDTPFGSHLAAHMALGALFLGGGTSTFGTSNLAIASLCIAFYPLFPSDVLDNRGHLQALRHLWVLAVEGRCLIARSVESGGNVIGGIEGRVVSKNGAVQNIRAPGLLPDLDTIQRIVVTGEGYWEVSLDFTDPLVRARAEKDQAVNVLLAVRASYDKPPHSDALVAELAALDDANAAGVPSVNPNLVARSAQITLGAGVGVGEAGENPFEWLFILENLKGHDHSEKALVMSDVGRSDTEAMSMNGTVVDTRLELEKGILNDEDDQKTNSHDRVAKGKLDRDKLWQLRLLFSWTDRWESEDTAAVAAAATTTATITTRGPAAKDTEGEANEDVKWGSGTWLRKEVIERLRDRVWRMTLSSSDDEDDG